MLNSSSRRWVLYASLLVICSCLVLLAAARSVKDAVSLRDALLDASTSSISLEGPIILDSGSFAPVSLDRTVSISAASPAAYLDFGSAQDPQVIIDPGGNLTLQGLQLVNIHPVQPLPLSQASSGRPLSAISSNSTSAHLLITRCVLLVDGAPSSLIDTLPFWAARQQANELQGPQVSALSAAVASVLDPSSSPLPAQSAQSISIISSYSSTPGGDGSSSSSIQITNTAVVFNFKDCISPGQQLLAWDSLSLSYALQSARARSSSSSTSQVLLLADVTLSLAHWMPSRDGSGNIPNVQIGSCRTPAAASTANPSRAPVILDLGHLPGVFLLQSGASLNISNGIVLVNAAAISQVYSEDQQAQPSWPYSNRSSSALTLLTLGSIDVSHGGRLILQDVAVGVQDTAAVEAAMQKVIGAGGSKPSLVAAAGGMGGAAGDGGAVGFVVSAWDTSLAAWSLGGTSVKVPAADGARLTMQDVTVLQLPSLCNQQQQQDSTTAAVVATEAQLLAALADGDIGTILITSDITLHSGTWQGLQRVKLKRTLVLHGCSSIAGSPAVLDFSDLQGQALFLVGASLRFSGDLLLQGIPDHPGAPGSWVMLPLLQLTNTGSLQLQGVQLHGYSQPLLKEMDSMALGRSSVVQFNSSTVLVHLLTLPRSAASRLMPVANSNSSSGGAKQLRDRKLRTLQQLPSTAGSSAAGGSSAGVPPGEAYYAWVGTQLTWGGRAAAPAPTQGLSNPGAIAAVVLGSILGLVLILAAVALLLQRRHMQHQQYIDADSAGKHSNSCWSLCCGQGPEQQLLPPGYGASYTEYNNSWGPQMPPGASVLASFGSGGQVYGDGLVEAGLRYNSGTSQGAAGAAYHGQVVSAGAAGHLVHTSPNSGTTGMSVGLALGIDGEPAGAGNLYELEQQQQQYGPDLEHTQRSFLRGAAGAETQADQGNGGTVTSTEGTGQHGAGGRGQHKQQVFEAARRQLGATAGDLAPSDALVLEAVLGEGSFGKVFRGYWKGTLVAVKTMVFPAAMSGKEKREKMAIMETAISASLSHPNIVQMYTYYLRPVLVGHEATLTWGAAEAARLESSSVGDSTMNAAFLNEGLSDSVHSWEVQLVLEYCDKGSLRALLNKQGVFMQPDGRRDLVMTLDTALDVARAMVHLHSENIIHSDLKARNILLKSSGGAEGRPFVAKVADFGLSMRIDPNATHVSNVYQGTMTHMAPEVMLRGKLSRQSDVYAFGVLLWELYSGGHAFKGIPRALLGHEVAHQQRRPQFPDDCPFDFQLLACRCWESDASIRPSFAEILQELLRMRERMAAAAAQKAASGAQLSTDQAAAGAASTAAAAAAAGRPQSEPIQGHTRALASAPAAATSDPVHGVRGVTATAAIAGAVAASAAAVAAAAAAAAGSNDIAAVAAAAAAVDELDNAAACEQQQLDGVQPSGRLPSQSVPLLLPVPDEPSEQQQQQQQHREAITPPRLADLQTLLQQQQPEQEVRPGMTDEQQQQLQYAEQAAVVRRHSGSVPHPALLDDVLLQVSLTGGSSMMAGDLVRAPHHPQPRHAPQNSCPPQLAELQAAAALTPTAGATAGTAAAAAGACAGPSESSPLPLVNPAGFVPEHGQEQEQGCSEYHEDSSSFSACGPGALLYGAARHMHRPSRVWGFGGSTATASEEAPDVDEAAARPADAPAAAAATAAAAAESAASGAGVARGSASEQHSFVADGNRSNKFNQGMQHGNPGIIGAAVAAGAQQLPHQQQPHVAVEQQLEAAPGAPEAAPRLGQQLDSTAAAVQPAAPTTSRRQRLGAQLQKLSTSARMLLRPGSNQRLRPAVADTSAGLPTPPAAAAAAAAGQQHADVSQAVVAPSDVLLQQQPASAWPSAAAAAPMGPGRFSSEASSSRGQQQSSNPSIRSPLTGQQQQDAEQQQQLDRLAAAAAGGEVHGGPPRQGYVAGPGLAPQAQALAAAVAAAAGAAGLPSGFGTAAAGGGGPAGAGAGVGAGAGGAPLQPAPCEPSASGSRSVTVYSSGDSSSERSSSLKDHGSSSDQDPDEQQRKLDETEAAIAAVMSLKASLAKQAFAGHLSRQRSSLTVAAAANRLAVHSNPAPAASAGVAAGGVPYMHSVEVVSGAAATTAATITRPTSLSVMGPGYQGHSDLRLQQSSGYNSVWRAAAGTGAGAGFRPPPSPNPQTAARAASLMLPEGQQQQQQQGVDRLSRVSSWQHAITDAPTGTAAAAAAAAAALTDGQAPGGAAVSGGSPAGGRPGQPVQLALPLHLIEEQLSALEAKVPGTAVMMVPRVAAGSERAPAHRRLSADAATAAAAQAAAAAAVDATAAQDSSRGPANSRPWQMGLANMAAQLLQPALAGPRSPKHQQQQQQQQQLRMAPRWSPRTNWKPPLRKTVSASQLGSNRHTAVAGSATPNPTPAASGGLPRVVGLYASPSQTMPTVFVEESTASTTGQGPATGTSSIHAPPAAADDVAAAGVGVTGRASVQLPLSAAQQRMQQQQQQRLSLQLPLGSPGGPEQLGLSGLDQAQLQLLAQVADAARAQVSPLTIAGDAQGDALCSAGSLSSQQRWRSTPNAAAPSEPLTVLRPQQQQQVVRLRPQHVASFNQPGVRQYGTSAAAMAATAAAAGGAGGVGGVPRAPCPTGGSGVSGAGRQSPGGRPRRSSAPVVGQQLRPPQQQQQQVWHGQQQQQ